MKSLIILIGLPGSGKSTLCNEFPGFYRVSQDKFKGDRNHMIEDFLDAVDRDENIIVDRTNINKKQRKDFIKVAKANGYDRIECIYLMVDPNTCITRIMNRKEHETIAPNTPVLKVAQIVNRFYKQLESPSFEEGFDVIEVRK